MIAIVAGFILMVCAVRGLWRDCSPTAGEAVRVDRLVLWGFLVDAGLALCAIGTQSAGGYVGGALTLLWHVPARMLAWLTLISLGYAINTRCERGVTVADLRGILRTAPIRAVVLCFALVASLGVSPLLTPEGRALALHAVSGQELWLGLILSAPSILMLWITAQVVMAACMTPDGPAPAPASGAFSGISGYLGGLAAVLALLGLGRAAVVAGVAGVLGIPYEALPQLESHGFNLPVLVLYGMAFPLLIQAAGLLPENKFRLTRWYPALACAISFALVVVLPLEPLARLFGLITTGIGGLVCVYSIDYIHEDGRKPMYFFLLLATFGAVLGVVTSSGAGSFMAWWEIMTWASFVLIAWECTAKARAAALLYMLICGAGACVLMPGLYALTGEASLFEAAAHVATMSPFTVGIALLFAFAGFAAKAGIMPFHMWLPEAHPEAPSSLSAPLSGVLTKAGIFGMVVVFWAMAGNDAILNATGDWAGLSGLGFVTMTLGVATMILGELKALQQDDLKRMLAYSTIGQIGEIMAVLSIGTWLALTGSLAHVLNHAIMKDLLFLCAGVLIMRTGSRSLKDLAGAARFMPWTTGCMIIGLVSIMGLPPFNGFVSKYIMIVACVQAGHFLLAAALLVASLVGAIYYMRVLRMLLFVEPTPEQVTRLSGVKEVSWTLRAPLVVLAGLCVFLGIVPQAGLSLVTPVVDLLAQSGQIVAGTLPGVHVGWPMYVTFPMLCAWMPWRYRHEPKRAALCTALTLAFTTLMVLFFARDLDMLSYGMALLVPSIAALNMVYSIGYMEHSHTQWRFYVFFLFMTGGLLGVAVSTNLFSFFTFWEIMSSWALFFAIAHEGTREAVREAFKYFLFNVAGAACLFLGVGILAGIGQVSAFGDVRQAMIAMGTSPWSTAVMALMALGFTMKAAQVALRIDWQMHPNLAPTPVSGYISSVLLKIAVFGMVKLFLEFGGAALQIPDVADPFAQRSIMYLVALAGAFTLLYAALKAMMQERIKMVFIWSTVSQIGYMVLAVALGTSLGVASGLLHMVNHMIFKDLLFLMAGAVMFSTHQEEFSRMGGLGRTMPVTMACFLIAALSAAGVPPTSGFTSKWLIYQALMQDGEIFLALVSLIGSVITLAYLARVLHVVFLGQPAPEALHAQDPPLVMRVPMLILAAITLITGIFPGLFLIPINVAIVQFGLPALDLSLTGVNSGAGAWNALLLSTLSLVAFGGIWWAMECMLKSVPQRLVAPHACGHDCATETTRMPATNVYQSLIQLLRLPRPALPPDLPTLESLSAGMRAFADRVRKGCPCCASNTEKSAHEPRKGA